MRTGAAPVSFHVRPERGWRMPAWSRRGRGGTRRSWSRRLPVLIGAAALLAVFTAAADQAGSTANAAEQARFDCSTGSGTYTVPVGTTEIEVRVAGAAGASGVPARSDGSGGTGAIVAAVIPVTAGQTLGVYLGCGRSGYHYGGSGGRVFSGCDNGSDGGGSSAVTSSGSALVEAGGGGGGGGGGCYAGGNGGNGGQNGDLGDSGGGPNGGFGGNGGLSSGSGSASDGGALLDENVGGGGGGGGGCQGGTGGGGGYNTSGGGGGGGGGGSSCVGPSVTAPPSYLSSGNANNGYVTIDAISLSVGVTATYTDSNGDGVEDPGDTIGYAIVVTNNSSVALTGVAVTGTLTGSGASLDIASCGSQTFQANSTTTCSADYTLVLADINRGKVDATVRATGDLPVLSGQNTALTVTSSGTATTPLSDTPKLTVANTISGITDTNGNGVNDVGDVIHYRVEVTNAGNSTVAGLTVTESAVGAAATAVALTCDPTTPAAVVPGGAVVCTGSYTISQSDIDISDPSITATANASGTTRDGNGHAVTGAASAVDTKLTQNPQLSVKLAPAVVTDTNGDQRTDAGDTIGYTATVTNTGSVTLNGVGATLAVTTPAGPAPTLACTPTTPAKLAPGAQLTCTGSYTITQADMDKGEVVATAAATGVFGVTTVNATPAQVTTKLQQSTGLSTVISVSGVVDQDGDGKLQAGDTVKYSVAVTNTGSVTLSQVSVVDQMSSPAAPDPALTCTPREPTKLAAGAVLTCTGSYVVTQADVDKGTLTATATATGLSSTLDSISSDPSSVTTTLGAAAAMTVTNTVTGVADNNHNGVNDAGDVISYSVVATNTGSVTLTTVAIADQLAPPAGPALKLECSAPAPVTIAPGDTLTCTVSYTITQADVDKGTVLATATATAKAPGDKTVTAGPTAATTTMANTVALAATNVVTSVEDRNGDSVTDQGDVIVYSVTLTNKGSVTVGTATAVEGLAGPASSTPLTCDPTSPGTLAPGATMTCTGSYQITAADVRNGSVKATATGSAVTPAGAAVHAAAVVVDTPVSPTPAGATPASETAGSGGNGGGTSGGGAVHGDSSGSGAGSLPFTGANIMLPLIGGVSCLIVGVALMLMVQRRRRQR